MSYKADDVLFNKGKNKIYETNFVSNKVLGSKIKESAKTPRPKKFSKPPMKPNRWKKQRRINRKTDSIIATY